MQNLFRVCQNQAMQANGRKTRGQMGRLVYFVNNANYPAHPCLLRNLRNYYFRCKWQWQNFVEQIIVWSPKNNIKSQTTTKMNFDKLLGKPVFKNHYCNPSQSFQIFLLLYLPCNVYLFWFFERLFLCFTPFGDSSGYNIPFEFW